MGFHVIGENVQPTEENVRRFTEQIRDWVQRGSKKQVKKMVRGLNQRIVWFAHQYKMGAVKKIYEKLDEIVRGEFRRYLKSCQQALPLASGRFTRPEQFPVNLAFSISELNSLGLASLVRIVEAYNQKKQGERVHRKNGRVEAAIPEIVEVSRHASELKITMRSRLFSLLKMK